MAESSAQSFAVSCCILRECRHCPTMVQGVVLITFFLVDLGHWDAKYLSSGDPALAAFLADVFAHLREVWHDVVDTSEALKEVLDAVAETAVSASTGLAAAQQGMRGQKGRKLSSPACMPALSLLLLRLLKGQLHPGPS